MTDNKKRIAVVTGANRGIGFEVCRELAQNDIDVILTSRDENMGKAAAQQLKDEGSVRYHQLDVTDMASIGRLKKFVEEKCGRCDILVNNAGIFPDADDASEPSFPSIFDTKIETMRKAMETNVYGAMLLCQALVPVMKKRNYGRVVNLSSGMGQLTYVNGCYPAYRVSKTSINALTRIMSEELKEFNILVNSMCPGWVKTDMGGRGLRGNCPKGRIPLYGWPLFPMTAPGGSFSVTEKNSSGKRSSFPTEFSRGNPAAKVYNLSMPI